jgi:hypothetical protein
MPITFSCACGQTLEMADEYAGKQARCPSCQAVVTVPSAVPPPPLPPAAPPKARLAEADPTDDDHAAGAASLNPLDRQNPPSRRRRRGEDEDALDEDYRPRRRRMYDDDEPRQPAHKLWNSRVTGGIVSAVIGLVWGGIVVAMGRIPIVAPILFVLGVVNIIRGLVSGRDE